MQGVLQDQRSKSFIKSPVSLFAGYCVPAVEEAVVAGQDRNYRRARIQIIDDGTRSLNMEPGTQRGIVNDQYLCV